jgi:hypothetical protein
MALSAATSAWVASKVVQNVKTPGTVELGPLPEDRDAALYAVRKYDAAIADLERAYAEVRPELDAVTVGAVEHSLASAQRAVDRARLALRENPDDAFLRAHYARAMRQKMKVLRRATGLSNDMI